MASIVIRSPLPIDNDSISALSAVISLLFAGTRSCPRETSLVTSYALTMCTLALPPSLSALLISFIIHDRIERFSLPAERILFPSMAICLLIDVEESVFEAFDSERQQAHSLYRLSSLSGFMMLKKRLKVSWEGVDSSPGMKLLKKSIFIFP